MSLTARIQPTRPDPGVKLLGRALAYTHGALVAITPGQFGLPTPCDRWQLADLLAHMEDSLDAFAEGANGAIGLRSAAPSPATDRVENLQIKACALLDAWASRTSPVVRVGGLPMPVDTIARLAALEITVHGWDIARTIGLSTQMPTALAEALLPTALTVALDQHDEFGPPVLVSADAGPAVRLLGLLGRHSS